MKQIGIHKGEKKYNMMTFESAKNKYEIIKDEDKRNTERLNEFAEILSCIYSQNEKLANDMWQYLVEKCNDISGYRFYVIRLLNALQLDYKSTWKLLIMDKKRVEILFKYAYPNTNISYRAYEVILGYINSNMIEEAVMVIELVKNYEIRFSILDGIKLIVVKIEQNIIEDDVTLKERINLFYEKCICKYQSDYFTTIFEIKLNLHNRLTDKEKLKSCLEWIVDSNICNEEYFGNNFVMDYCQMLYLNRLLLSDEELLYYVELFCNKYKNRFLSYRCTEEICDWIVEISQKSTALLNNLIFNDYRFGNRYIQKLITEEKWIELKRILQYCLTQKEQTHIVNNISETLSYFEQIFDEGIAFTDTVNIQATEGVSVDMEITLNLPKIIIRDAGCYDVEEKNVIFICNIIIDICKNNGICNELTTKAEHVKKLYNTRVCES